MLARFYTSSGDAQAQARCVVPARVLPAEVANPLLHTTKKGLPSVWQNPARAQLDSLLEDVAHENTIVIDVDDPYHETSDRYGEDEVRAHKMALDEARCLIVTNEALAASYEDLHPDIRIIPTSVDPSDWEFGRMTQHLDGKLRIGYAAGFTHAPDAKLPAAALAKISEHPDVIVEFVGPFDPGWEFEYNRYPALPFPAYKAMLQTWSIGLAPLVESSINETRSDLKFLDYAISGAACVVSPYGPFEHIVDKKLAAYASDDDEWYDALLQLVENDDLRAKIAMGAYHYCRIERHPANQRVAYLDALGLRRSTADVR